MWVFIALVSLAVLITLVLCIPLDLTFRLDVHGRPKFSLRLVWFFGLVRPELGKGKRREEKKREAKAKPKPPGRRGGARFIFQILRTKGLLRQLMRLLRGVIGSFRIRGVGADLRVGLDNPADTGLLFAVIGPATHFLGSSRFHEVRVEPAFDEAVCEGYLQGGVGLQPIQLVGPLTAFVFSPVTLRIIRTVVSSRWKSRR